LACLRQFNLDQKSWGGSIKLAETTAKHAGLARGSEADRAEAKASSVRMEGYGAPGPIVACDRTMPQRRVRLV
jgi:hypothetical protein